jgi:hypothetical protein
MEATQHSLLAACFTLHSLNATLAIVPQRGAGLWIIRDKVKALLHSETSINFQRTAWSYIPEDKTVHNDRCETLNPS